MNKKLLAISVFTFACIGIASAQIDKTKVSLYLPFNESIADQSGKNITVAQSTITAGTVTYVDGKFGKAAAFNSSPLVTTGIDFISNQDFTIAAWVKLAVMPADASINAGQTIIHQKDVTTPATIPGRIHLEVVKAGYLGSFTSAVRLDNNANGVEATMSTGQWYHVAHVQDATLNTRYLYVDGVLVNTISPMGSELNSSEFVIGGPKTETGNALLKQGQAIDDLFVTRQALDATTIANIYANGVAALISSVNNTKASALSKFNYKQNMLSVQLSNELQTAKVEVFNTAGQNMFSVVAQNNSNNFNISLNKGLYILKVTAGEYSSVVKFSAE